MGSAANTMGAIALALPVIFNSSVSFALDNSNKCSCVADENFSHGLLTEVRGEVLSTGQDGYRKAVNGEKLKLGSFVTVGPVSSAKFEIANQCQIDLAANSELLVSKLNENVCVNVSNTLTQDSASFASETKLSDANAKRLTEALNSYVKPNSIEAAGLLDGTGLSSEMIFFSGMGGIFATTAILEGNRGNGGATPATP